MNRSRVTSLCLSPDPAPLLALLSLSLSLSLVNACGPVPGDAAAAETETESGTETSVSGLRVNRPPAFRDVEESFTSEDDQNRWFQLLEGLRQNFDDICGDTFCEGDFSNLQSMSFRCSVSTRTGELKTCLWLFAGSYETVTASSGNIRPVTKFFSCPIAVTGTPHALLDALLPTTPMPPPGGGPLWAPLPGSPSSIYDQLGNCL